MSKMETISLYEEGTGVHICIPNITVEEVKKLIAGLVVNQITSLLPNDGVKSENIPAEELEMDDNNIPTSKELNETRVSENSSETLNESENELADKANELPWNNVSEKSEDNNNNENPGEISETENNEINSADNSADKVIESAESESNESNSNDNKAVIEAAPDLNIDDAETTNENVSEDNISENNSESNNSEPTDDVVKETSSEELTSEESAANDKEDTNETNANNTSNSNLVLTIKPDKDYDKVLNGLKAVVYIKINNLPMDIVDNTIVINTNGLSESDIEYIKKMAAITKSFEI